MSESENILDFLAAFEAFKARYPDAETIPRSDLMDMYDLAIRWTGCKKLPQDVTFSDEEWQQVSNVHTKIVASLRARIIQ